MNNMNNKVTTKTIAQALNITHTTVSNAFNKPEKLSKALREKILVYAEEVGYDGPNIAARFLQAGKSGTIGIVFNKHLSYVFSDSHTLDVYSGIAEVCEKNGLSILLLPLSVKDQILNAVVDGYILNATFTQDPIIKKVLKKQMPLVTIDFQVGQHSSVAIDNHSAMAEMTNLLLKKGHKEFGIISFPLSRKTKGIRSLDQVIQGDNQVAINRVEGVKSALLEANMQLSQSFLYETQENEEGAIAVEFLLKNNPNITALICFSDHLALHALAYCRENKIDVPNKIAISGFDDIKECISSNIPLTSINQDAKKIGKQAAELLLSKQKMNILIEHKLIERQST